MMVRWYTHYLTTINHIATATVRGVSVRRLLKQGIPRGGILSPFAWNANVDWLLALFDMFDPQSEDKDQEAQEQEGTSFYDLG